MGQVQAAAAFLFTTWAGQGAQRSREGGRPRLPEPPTAAPGPAPFLRRGRCRAPLLPPPGPGWRPRPRRPGRPVPASSPRAATGASPSRKLAPPPSRCARFPPTRSGPAAPGAPSPGPRVRPHEESDPTARPSPPAAGQGPRGPSVPGRNSRSPFAALQAMDATEPQPDPDGGDAPGHEPGGSPQDEFDFSILFDYDYLNPIEGRWRLLLPGAGSPGRGVGKWPLFAPDNDPSWWWRKGRWCGEKPPQVRGRGGTGGRRYP